GFTQGVVDADGADTKTHSDLTGSITGDDVVLEVHEQHINIFASSTSLRLMPSMRGSANQFFSTIGNVLKTGGETYRYNNIQVETGSKEKGNQGSAGVVAVKGIILRNDRPFAECTLQNGIPIAVAGGTVIPLATASQ